MATAVMHCHAHGLLHGQMRPEHVLMDADGSARLLGFEPPCWRQLRRGTSAGSAHALRPTHYMDAPELQGRTHALAAELQAADVWALGVLGTAIIAGRPPLFSGKSDGSVEMPIGMQASPAAETALLASLLCADPADRPAVHDVVSQAKKLMVDLHRQLPLADVPLGSLGASVT